ncbi:sodium:solute symporter family protein [Halomonas sp. KAO]|uniref:sodium:solute symporter family protein n=1 Tax=unclassified Halomonas TaxID=2609666 RepID=UPI0018A0E04C|nr:MULTISPECIES: sodium:solute symporter family protein [unclassified Halomonas]MBF7054872.1 sodium:solute symporter family protein [Halomonas sp. KAO]MDT0501531.1 sodium:solute symporter family protein [Halomonas sp. PAR7]MDT0512787.1 sodium:solute symporter family protein [Halomonas sp. LES1]MDT0591388.1 sodium:solute symporter family protein [Halomonas sp. PAR8]
MLIPDHQLPAVVALTGVYATFILLYAYYFYRKVKTFAGYNVAGRSIPLVPMILTILGTSIGGAMLLGLMADAYRIGISQMWMLFPLIGVLAILTAFFVRRLRQVGDKHELFTVGDYAAVRFGPLARYPASIANLVAISALTGMQFVALATILRLLFGLETTHGILIACAFLTLKTYLGGFTSVVWSDAVQGTIQTIGIVSLFAAIYVMSGGWGEIVTKAGDSGQRALLTLSNISTYKIALFMLTLGAAVLVRQDFWSRIWAARDLRTTIKAYWWSVVLVLITGLVVVLTGVFAKIGLGIVAEPPAMIYYHVIQEAMPFWFFALMLITLMATVVSCADSYFIAGASTLVSDFVQPHFRGASDRQLLMCSRGAVIVMALISLLLALAVPRLIQLWITGSAILVSSLLVPLLLGVLWTRPSRRAGACAMWAGLVVAMAWQLLGEPGGWSPVFVGVPASALMLAGIMLLDARRAPLAPATDFD